MNTTILTKEQFERQSFKHWLKKGIMYNNYEHYLRFAKAEYKSEFKFTIANTGTPKRLYIWRSMDDDKVRGEHAKYDDKIFDWNDEEMIKPGEDYGCRCYAEFIENGLGGGLNVGDKVTKEKEGFVKKTGDKGSIQWDENKNKFERIEKEKTLISSPYGKRIHPIKKTTHYHRGTDFAVPVGTPIPSPVSGKVDKNDCDKKGNGNRISIIDDNGIEHHFYHMREQSSLKKGERINKEDVLGYSGNTGLSSGPHVHYETRKTGGGDYKERVIPPKQEYLDYLDNYWLNYLYY